MIGAFSRSGGVFRAHLSSDYNLLLRRLIREILVILDDPGPRAVGPMVAASTSFESGRDAPEERALGHLLPAMSAEPELAANLREMTEDGLRADKSARLRRIDEALGRVGDGAVELTIPEEDVWDWLGAFNDVRLGLAGELGLDSDEDAERIADLASAAPTGGRDQSAAAIYMLLTWWQDSLLLAMKSGARDN